MSDAAYMGLALAEAEAALGSEDVPVGAIVVVGGEVVGRGRNERERRGDPTAHAEMLALRSAAQSLGRRRLAGATLYVTLEPCPMCAGAAVLARVDRLVYGPFDPKAGAALSLYNIPQDPRLNHEMEVVPGVRAEECAELLRRFFVRLRPVD